MGYGVVFVEFLIHNLADLPKAHTGSSLEGMKVPHAEV